jgi:CheY-like chemotaxis protein
VTLAAARDPARADGLELTVTDSGPGMSVDTVRRLFERYEQGAAPGPLRRAGSGLGLAIARRLTELMGGTIEVDSEPGRGSRFRVRLALPAVPVATAPIPALPRAALPIARRLLVVEDDAVTREVVVELLRAGGHAVDAGANGLDALRMLDEHRYDAALIDLDLPGVDGLKLVRMLRKREAPHAPRLYTIAITARTTPDSEAQCRDAGFDAFLRKPLTGEQLEAALAELPRRA